MVRGNPIIARKTYYRKDINYIVTFLSEDSNILGGIGMGDGATGCGSHLW